MKAKEAKKILGISQTTLWRYSKKGLVKRRKIGMHYDYDDESVYQLLNKDRKRKTYLYARVSTRKQKKALESQIQLLKSWTLDNGYPIHGVYSDIASGIDFDKRKEFFQLLADVLDYKVERIVLAYKDRLARVGFSFFHKLFQQFGTEILILSEIGNPKLDSEDIFEEIISLLHCYSMKMYSKRREKKVLEVGFHDSQN